MKIIKYLTIILISFSSILVTSCGEENDDILIGEETSPSQNLSKPEFDKYLTTTTMSDVSLRCRFTNGSDTWENMKCTVHWRKYTSKPSSTPKASDMNKHESMRIYATTSTKTTFDKTHTGFSGGNYVYYYFECSNSKYTTKTDVTYCIVKR